MKFDPDKTEIFRESDGTEFEFNFDRVEHIASDIFDTYRKNVKKMKKKHLKSKKKHNKHFKNMGALFDEWHTENSEETLYLVFSDDNNKWTEMVSDNALYPRCEMDE